MTKKSRIAIVDGSKDLTSRFIRYMIVENEVVFEQRNGKRTGRSRGNNTG